MVAVTVIIATVVSAFALTLADNQDDEPINAAVAMEVDETNEEITVRVVSMGNAEYIVLRGPLSSPLMASQHEPFLNETGQKVTLNDSHLRNYGHVAAVGIRGNYHSASEYKGVPTVVVIPVKAQSQVNRVDYDFRE